MKPWENPWDAYLEDPGGDYLLRVGRDNRIVLTVEAKQKMTDILPEWDEMTRDFQAGYWDADLDLDPGFTLRFDSSAYGDNTDEYHDGYTVRWFPLTWDNITCGLRTDLPKAQRRHDWVCLGFDTANKMEKGICEVLVFACSRCGRDWRG